MGTYIKLTDKLHHYVANNGEEGYIFWCPGCDGPHSFPVKRGEGWGGDTWLFSGDPQAPSFIPSLWYQRPPCCHLYLTNGQIQFLPDCSHKLAGQTVPLIDWPTHEPFRYSRFGVEYG